MDLYTLTSQEVLERISRHCPESMGAYLHCLNRCNDEGVVYFSREMVEVEMSENWMKFKNRIKKLALENILEWHPFHEGISVTMMDEDYD